MLPAPTVVNGEYRFTVIIAGLPVVLVAVNLSIMAFP